jgi:two-component system cell cycle sensor histidine kinase/response regulator CckA
LVGDASQLTQILVNLAVNARDALLESTPTTSDSTLPHRIELSARPATLEDFSNTTLEWKPDWVAIEVRDNGPGIPPEIVNHVFEPFFTTKSAGKGTGLGLWNCLGVVQSHGGTLALENLPRHGACFRILLPSHQTAPANFPEATDPELDTITPAKGRVLLVDDEESIREHASMALEADGWEVETAHDGEAALERFRNRTADFHLVVLDLSLPSLPGREVARQILSERPSQSILVMTGFDLGANEAEPEIPGTRGTLLKPFRMAKLVRECRKLLASAYA